MENEPLEVGFLIGLTSNSQIVFEIVGSNPNLVQLLGLLRIAESKITEQLNKTMKTNE